jgi:hypothetical protein
MARLTNPSAKLTIMVVYAAASSFQVEVEGVLGRLRK